MAIYKRRKSEVVKTKIKDLLEIFITCIAMGIGLAVGMIIVSRIAELF